MTAQHVPAWKRLGLTLKHAKDIPLPPSPVAANEGHKSKRRHDEIEESQTPKKRKVDDSHELKENNTPIGKTSLRASPEKSIPSSIRKSPTKTTDRRKSVSFSTDTKTEDGDTAQNAFRAWVAEQNYIEAEEDEARRRAERTNSALASTPADPPLAPSSTPASTPASIPASTPAAAPAATPEKSSKKKSKSKDPKPDTTSTSVPPAQKKVKVRTPKTSDKPVPEYIHYLENYYNDRPSWKFNKSKQNDLLKNVWNVYRVPPHLNDALVEYISGLQGAGARQRLKDAARTIGTETVAFIRREIPESKTDPMDTVEARRAALEAAEQRELERLKSLGLDLGQNEERVKTLKEKRDEDERAARLLSALIGDALHEMNGIDTSSAQEPKQETARARKKKKRSRTVASDSDSSSDSDSESDSDAGDRPSSKKKQKTETKAKASTASDSDSDSTSSSDSDSDSSSDSDSDSTGSGSSSDSDSSESEDDSSDDNSDSETG